MNVNLFNLIFEEFKKEMEEIKSLKIDIKKLEDENKNKIIRNQNVFDESMQLLNNKELQVKNLMENKHFTFIKYLDFIDARNIESNNGMELNTDLGFLTAGISKTTDIELYKKSISNEGKTLTFEFDETSYSNRIDFSFKIKNGLPIAPSKTTIEYSRVTETLFEPNFRYYNRNRADIFNNTFFYYPKKIKKVIFEFDEQVIFENALCTLKTCEYDTDENKEVVLRVNNEKGIKSFNLSKITDESFVPLEFLLSEDNLEYKTIEFNDQRESVLIIKEGLPFNIKIKTRYDLVKRNAQYDTYKEVIPKNSLIRENGYLKFDKDDNAYNLDVNLTHSSYVSLKRMIDELVYPDGTQPSDRMTIDDVIEIDGGIYRFKKNLILVTNDVDEKANSMIYQDDFSIVANDKFYLNFILDVKNNRIYFSEFMDQFNFYVELGFEKMKEMVSENLMTPYVFNLSLKG
ncbi:MAG: hypothetical protein ACRCX2_09245 [Paraclostridium sp.]